MEKKRMNKKLIKNLLLIIIPLLVIAAIFFNLENAGIITDKEPIIKSDLINTTLIIDYGDEEIDRYNLTIKNATVYSVLINAREEFGIDFKAKYNKQYQSHYVYSINSYKEENNKFWQYYINGEYGKVGADLQIVSNNDIIEWKLQKPKI